MKKIILIIIFIILFLGISQNVYAGKLLLEYPEMGGIKLSEEPTLPEIIKYIYLFSLGIVGFVALISMLIGAIRYIASAGNASKAEDAKDQMTQAILGIIILLAAVLILGTINPDLVKLKFTLPENEQQGSSIYKCVLKKMPGCNDFWVPGCKDSLEEAKEFCKDYAKQYNIPYNEENAAIFEISRKKGCGELGCTNKVLP